MGVLGVLALSLALMGKAPDAAATPRTLAAFKAADPTNSTKMEVDVHVLAPRLKDLGSQDVVALRRHTIIVSGSQLPVSATGLASTGTLYVRPVLCYAPSFSGTLAGAPNASTLPPGCPPQYQLVTSNLNGSASDNVPYAVGPDPALAAYPSTQPAADNPFATVLLPELGDPPSSVVDRVLLGPAPLTNRGIHRAVAVHSTPRNAWLVTMTLTRSSSQVWNAMARPYFHELVGFDFDGVVLSAPITEPSQSTFSSFGSSIQLGGSFSSATARTLAAALTSGPLRVPLSVG